MYTPGTGKTHVIVALLSTLLCMYPPSAVEPADTDIDLDLDDLSSTSAHRIFVKGLPWAVNDREVRGFFVDCGTIVGVEMPRGNIKL